MKPRWLAVIGVLALVAASCTNGETEQTTTTAGTAPTTTIVTATTAAPITTEAETTTTTETAPAGDVGRSLVAPEAAIAVDGDLADWADVTGLSLTMFPIEEREEDEIEAKDVTVRAAHDTDNVYMLVTVNDDYDWSADDAHLSGALAVEFPVSDGGPHMGADDEAGENSTGMVDIWHWELECAAGEMSGGSVNPPGDGDPGNDGGCNFDDEWATDAETREDDNSATGENSLTGTWWHTNPTDDTAGTWFFEMSRPLQTGDENDAQFSVGESALLALAYWDADFGPDGWDDSTHVTSAEPDWITVDFVSEAAGDVGRSLVAPEAAIAVDGDLADWADVTGLSLTMFPIEEREEDEIEAKDVTVRAAHDTDNVYMLVTVNDDYDWSADDAHLSGALAVEFPVSDGGPHMGADDEAGENSTGMVDIWHWELECAAGEMSGGSVNPPGDGDPGNDGGCNFDDEWATDAETREDDNSATGENSLTGTWWHTNPTDDTAGTWFFEMSRPLQTGDENDAQFSVGESALLALAYWDADFGPDGWDDSTHVTSAEPDWITVILVE